METLRVAFRIDRNRAPDSLTAVLPDVEANAGRWTCYAHVGQHSECSREWYYSTRPAKPREYTALLRELARIYAPAKLRVVWRIAR